MPRKKLTYEIIKERCKKNNKTLLWDEYQFNKNYKNSYTKVPVRCNTCNYEWEQIANDINKKGCPSCAGNLILTYKIIKDRCEKRNKTLLWDESEFEKKYRNNRTKVSIRCNECGYEWYQIISDIDRAGCPSCAGNLILTYKIIKDRCENNNKTLLWSKDEFEKKYKGSKTKVPIRCNKCRYEWDQLVYNIDKNGCQNCANQTPLTYKIVNGRCKENNKTLLWNESEFEKKYKGSKTKVPIRCNKCRYEWDQLVSGLDRRGCPYCAKKKQSERQSKPFEYYRNKDLKLNGNRDSYFPQYFGGGKEIKSKFRCNTCGYEYWQRFNDRLQRGRGCPNCCNNGPSKGERAVGDYIQGIYSNEIILNSRKVIPPKELDIYLPDINLAIEYNGTYWHSLKPEGYHRNKTERCKDLGIRLFHIPERAWTNKRGQDFWKQKIKNYINRGE